jgi:anti-anti-sigma factor
MSINKASEDIVVVQLPNGPQMNEDLQRVTELARDRGDCDVVVDFWQVDIVNSNALAGLLRLRKLLHDCEHQLVFCNVSEATLGIFAVTGLREVFEFVGDRSDALAKVGSARPASSHT